MSEGKQAMRQRQSSLIYSRTEQLVSVGLTRTLGARATIILRLRLGLLVPWVSRYFIFPNYNNAPISNGFLVSIKIFCEARAKKILNPGR